MNVAERLGSRVSLLLLGLLGAFAVAEISARLFHLVHPSRSGSVVTFQEYDPLLGWRNRANASGTYAREEFSTTVHLNAAGQRGPLFPLARSSLPRIALLGDSQAWGDGVEDDEVFGTILAREGVEVVNFSCPGYGTDQELLMLEHRVPPYAPDLVLVAVYVGNDFDDNRSHGSSAHPKPYFSLGSDDALRLHNVPVPYSPLLQSSLRVYRSLALRSAFLDLVGEASEHRLRWPGWLSGNRTGLVLPHSFSPSWSDEDEAALRLTRRLLIELADRARALHAVPVVLILPHAWQVEVEVRPDWQEVLQKQGVDWLRWQRPLTQALAEQGIDVIDALPALVAERRRSRVFYETWNHLTADGHRAVAALLRNELWPRLPGLPGR